MDNLSIAVLSLIIGGGISFWASRRYYKISIKKSLTPFMQLQSNILSHIDKDVRSDLNITYKEKKVENLQQLQFLIANTGERAIEPGPKPLTLCLPKDLAVLDISIVHRHPEGREVEYTTEDNEIKFEYDLLNKDDFFIVKLLINGTPKREDLIFKITTAELDPVLNIKRLPFDQIESSSSKDKKKFNKGEFFIGIIMFLFGLISIVFTRYCPNDIIPKIENKYLAWINHVPFVEVAAILIYIISFMVIVAGAMLIVGSFIGNFSFPSKRKFIIPEELIDFDFMNSIDAFKVFQEVEQGTENKEK